MCADQPLPVMFCKSTYIQRCIKIVVTFYIPAENVNGSNSSLVDVNADIYTFSATTHAHSLLSSVHTLRERKGLCDVTLRVEERQFAAHKVILAAGSPYFNAMFTNNHRESFASNIDLNGIDAYTVELLVEFIYSSSLEIKEDNVQNLLAGASLLQLVPVVEACCLFLKARVCADNCLGIAAFADLHGCTELYRYAWMFAIENFTEVVRKEEFLVTPAPFLMELLKCDDLQIRSEEEVLDCVLHWLQHDRDGRNTMVMSALEHVKLPLIPSKSLHDKLNQIGLLTTDRKCQSYLDSVKSHQMRPGTPKPHTEAAFSLAQYVPRRFVGQNMFVYAVGGETSPGRTTVGSVEQFDPAKNSWQELTPMKMCRRGVGVAILKGYLYAVGGSDGLQAVKLAERYDPACDTWTQISDMNEKRSSVAAAALGEYFYAIGGYTGVTSCLQSVERYDPNSDIWAYVANMIVPRSMACACSINGQIFMVGGYDGVSDLQSCEMFDPETNKWELIDGMQIRRCMAGVAVVDGLLYIAGGCDRAVSLKSVESYDPSSRKWTVLAEMTEARSGLGMAVIGRKLYSLGGHNGRASGGYCTSVEQYNTETDSWTVVATMTAGRRRFGCCS